MADDTASPTDRAELSSLASALDDLAARITAIADRRIALDPDDPIANELHEVDRLLQSANRRLNRVLRTR